MKAWTEWQFGARTFYPVVRTLGEMKDVVFDTGFLARANLDMELYYMFRDVSKDAEDEKRIKDLELRYDITIIPPNTLGLEFVKTAGHYHPRLPGTTMTYPEMYEVVEGEAHYLLQRRNEEGDKESITDVLVMKAGKGDKVIIPSHYGHVTINPSAKTLIMANWVARTFSSIYEPIKKKGGAAYFELTTGEFIKNEMYETVPDIRFLKPSDTWIPELGLSAEREMYDLLREPEKLMFLTNPAEVV
jgi:glucose-6-phosphate isomerase